MISIVCPFYNEEAILERSVELMLRNLETMDEKWELIIVNDGSEDRSLEIALRLEKKYTRLMVISYPINKGRGFAIRTGAARSQGKILVTTEIDSSWGDDIVSRIVKKFKEHIDADMVIASPHLPEGGYRNVPLKRVLLSKWGNIFIQASLNRSITMYTGMTRGYVKEKFLALPLDENEKEIHLEIANKAISFNYIIYEVPAILEWKTHKLIKNPSKKRKSSFNISKLIRTHLLFSLGAAPFRYIFPASGTLGILSSLSFAVACYKLFTPAPTIYWLLTSFFLALFGFLFFGIGLIMQQNRQIMRDLWRTRSDTMNCRIDDL